MGKQNELKDDFLKRMFKESSSLDAPSDDFTSTVMGRIQVEVVEKAEDDKAVIEPKYWILIIAGLAIAGYTLFQMDLSFIANMFSGVEIKSVELPAFTLNFFSSVKNFFGSFQVPSLFIIAAAAVISLITLDKVLKSRFSMNMFAL